MFTWHVQSLDLPAWHPSMHHLDFEVPLSTVEGFERSVWRHLHRWLGLPQSLRKITLYGHQTKLRLPFSSMSEEKCSSTGIHTTPESHKQASRWDADIAVDLAEVQLQNTVLMEAEARGSSWLGSGMVVCYEQAQGNKRHKRSCSEGSKRYKPAELLAWDEWAFSGKQQWCGRSHGPSCGKQCFTTSAPRPTVYDVLPSHPTSLPWAKLKHLLAHCAKGEGHYSALSPAALKPWETGAMVGTMTRHLRKQQGPPAMNNTERLQPAKRSIIFVREEEQLQPQSPKTSPTGILLTLLTPTLENEGCPISTRDHWDHLQTWHCHVVRVRESSGYTGVHCSQERLDGGSQWQEEGQVWRPGEGLSLPGVEHLVLSSGHGI